MRWRWMWMGLCLAASATAAETKSRVALPVSEVTVFGDRARVSRSAKVSVPAGGRVVLPWLPPTLDTSSVRVEGRGLSVSEVSVRRIEAAELPVTEAKALVDSITALESEARLLAEKVQVLEDERRFVQSIQPRATPVEGSVPSVFTFEPLGWDLALGFFDARIEKLDSALAPIHSAQRANERKLLQAREQAAQLLASTHAQPGYEVSAKVEGREGVLELVYLVRHARWQPSYEVRFDPESAKVQLALGALVSQETGEDWESARLVLSTGSGAAAAALPQLLVWKIGNRERFIPTPEARPRPRPPMPRPWSAAESKPVDEEQLKLRQLLARVAMQVTEDSMPRPPPAMAPSPPRSMPPSPMAMRESRKAERAAPQSMPSARMMAQGMAADMVGEADAEEPVDAVAFGAPSVWRPPVLPPDSPVSLADGHVFTYEATRRESIASGKQAVKVALGTVSLEARSVLRIFPALEKDAFLVTELVNSTARPLFKGKSTLFVGPDLVGEGEVPTTPKGAKLSLPLGIDDAISVERNVTVVESEKGVFSKDDVTTYEVVIEVQNPRAKAVSAVVVDQVPLATGEKVKVSLDSASPALASGPDADGLFEWKLELARGEKKTLKFRYSVVRPKNWQLWQHSQPKGGR